ncbi:MAG: hypothetical protein IJL69_04450, partial [Oscillospiraceae bacterium]|nr:hypothetical protein [Oscillospiraceae bacterium]
SLEVTSPLNGTHALRRLLDCPDVDFFCSPNSYFGLRDPDADWTEMYPADSVRLAGKLCLQECDVRTHLTRPLADRAPEYDPGRRLSGPIWQGLADRDAAQAMIRKSFCRQLIKGNGFWWFDMWGGWYDDPVLMEELKKAFSLYQDSLSRPERDSAAELAVFFDERMYAHMTDCPLRNAVFEQRKALGFLGAPYDLYEIGDFPAVFRRYRAVLLLTGVPAESCRRAAALCRENGLPFLENSADKPTFSAAELRRFCRACGVHLYGETDDVLYADRNYLAIHASTAGDKAILLPAGTSARALLGGRPFSQTGDLLTVSLGRNETALFALERRKAPPRPGEETAV